MIGTTTRWRDATIRERLSNHRPTVQVRRRRWDHRAKLILGTDVAAALGSAFVVGAGASGRLTFLIAVLGIDGLGRRRFRRLISSPLDGISTLVAPSLAVMIIATASGLQMYGDSLGVDHESAGVLIATLTFVMFALTGRTLCYEAIRSFQARGWGVHPTLIVGTGSVGAKLAWRLLGHPEWGLTIVGFVDAAPPARPELLPAPVLGDVTDLPKVIAERGVRHVFVAFTRMRDADLVAIVRACDRLDCEVYVVPRLFELGLDPVIPVDQVRGVALLRLNRAPFRTPQWQLKRLFDVTVAAVGLLALSPLLLAIALLLRLCDGPGVLFRQTRISLDGRPFEMVKFRTVRTHQAEKPAAWSVVDEAAIGAVGRFLRRSSLDELPQLWNVLRGQMSLVGPRPEQPRFVDEFTGRYRGYDARTRVPGGITGWAQIHDLRGATPLEDRVEFDNYYIENWSLWQDFKIILRTAGSIFGMRGG